MSISRKDFEQGNFKMRNTKINHPILVLLKKNINKAFKADEIAKKIRMSKNSVRSMLQKLQKDGLVIHKAPYFVLKKKKR